MGRSWTCKDTRGLIVSNEVAHKLITAFLSQAAKTLAAHEARATF